MTSKTFLYNALVAIIMKNYRNAAGCIVFKDSKILLLRRSVNETSQHGLYELPGGKQEEGESLIDTAIIETQEESGLSVKIIKKLDPHIDHNMKKIYHGYIATVEGDVKIELSQEHDEYKWLSVKDALDMKNPLSHHAKHLFEQII